MVRFGSVSSRNRKDVNTTAYMKYILAMMIAAVSFYMGMITGLSVTSNRCESTANPIQKGVEQFQSDSTNPLKKIDEEKVNQMVQERVQKALEQIKPVNNNNNVNQKPEPRFQKETSKFATGLARVKKKEFLELYDYGLPESYDDKGQEDALILYNHKTSIPDGPQYNSIINDEGIGIPLLDPKEATRKCESMNVIMTNSGDLNQCIAIVGNYESYHIQRWMRIGEGNGQKLDSSQPLRHVSRGMKKNGMDEFAPPNDKDIEEHWKLLRTYFESLDSTVSRLKPILSKIAVKNTIVVMVCNFGQSALLVNFVCAAKAKGFDISNVLLFATDEETLKLGEGLGLATFYDEANFSSLPSKEANSYGDRTFVAMMYAKVVTVQLVNMLGYDVLFQDVDIVWEKNPLDIFHDKSSEFNDYDILFQDDGARSLRYAPYCANSGFYYIRKNPRTRYLFTSLLYSGDLIMATHSHQQALNALLIEHSSLFGLKVKVLSGGEFPGGFHYHRRKELMHSIAEKKYTPYIFHMSWTKNKDNKLLFFRQMGMWYVKDQCIDDKALTTLNMSGGTTLQFQNACCAAEPLVSCHYSDKPSIIPCNDQPPIDKGGRPFWPKK